MGRELGVSVTSPRVVTEGEGEVEEDGEGSSALDASPERQMCDVTSSHPHPPPHCPGAVPGV